MIITDIEKLKIKSDEANEDEVKKILEELVLALKLSIDRGMLGVGLSAPQIGINKKVAIIRIGNIKIDLVNCEIIKRFDKIFVSEGCLSLPGVSCEIERSKQIIVSNNNFGSHKVFCAYGIVSVCIQHEMDHWDGILILDRELKKKTNIGLNQACPCGKIDKKTNKSIKYKKCCGRNKNG